jgi:hypothetical protein
MFLWAKDIAKHKLAARKKSSLNMSSPVDSRERFVARRSKRNVIWLGVQMWIAGDLARDVVCEFPHSYRAGHIKGFHAEIYFADDVAPTTFKNLRRGQSIEMTHAVMSTLR